LRRDGDELEVDATSLVDERALGMTWSPLGIVDTPSSLILRGRLASVSDQNAAMKRSAPRRHTRPRS
jgi:hypothetical protein